MEAALEAERVQLAEHLQERLLVGVLGIFPRWEHPQRDAKYTAVVSLDKLGERVLVASLRRLNQAPFG